MNTFRITYKLFHNSDNQTELGSVKFNGKRFKWELKNFETFSDFQVKFLHTEIKKAVKEFYFDSEAEKRKYPFRYFEEASINLTFVEGLR